MAKLSFYVKRLKEGRLKEMMRQIKWIYGYGKKHWKAMIIYTLLGLSGTLIGLLSSLVSKDMVDIVTGKQTGQLIATFCTMIGMTLGNTLINQVSQYVSTKINLKVDAEIKADIFGKILITDWESLTGYHTGDLLTRWSNDASQVSSGILSFIPSIIINFFRFVGALVVMVNADWTFALIALASMPLSYLISRAMMSKMRKNNETSAKITAEMSGFNQEAFSNIQTIKAFSLVPEYTKKLHKLQKEYIMNRLKYQKAYIGIAVINVLLGLVVSYASYGWGIYRVWSGAITYGSMTMFLTLSSSLSATLNSLIGTVPMAISLTISAGRLMDIVEMPREDFSNDEEVKAFYEKHREDGIELSMHEVSYTYKTGTEVFSGASLYAKPHEVVALVGPSGEGKTTMLRLILALILPKLNDSSIGNTQNENTESENNAEGNAGQKAASEETDKVLKTGNASEAGYAELSSVSASGEREVIPLNAAARQLFSYVPQGNTMFSGTIKSNMKMVKPDATDGEIIDALKLACAWDFVEKLPNGIESELQERGGGLSEGQAQRLSIARAILRKSPLLLLDEATSALDVATERRVLKNIMTDEYPRTCIVTTHRPTVLNLCNRVYSIRDKKCVVMSEEEITEMINAF